MKISLYCIGKTQSKELNALIDEYKKRLPSFINFEIKEIPDVKNAKNITENELKKAEENALLQYISTQDTLILLDEKGKEYTSVEFSKFIDNQMNTSSKHLIFAIGGALGFSEDCKQKAQHKISLSSMTFTHQMIRLFFVEQLYRAFSILQGKPYHNE